VRRDGVGVRPGGVQRHGLVGNKRWRGVWNGVEQATRTVVERGRGGRVGVRWSIQVNPGALSPEHPFEILAPRPCDDAVAARHTRVGFASTSCIQSSRFRRSLTSPPGAWAPSTSRNAPTDRARSPSSGRGSTVPVVVVTCGSASTCGERGVGADYPKRQTHFCTSHL
jgi:hypothetical protein